MGKKIQVIIDKKIQASMEIRSRILRKEDPDWFEKKGPGLRKWRQGPDKPKLQPDLSSSGEYNLLHLMMLSYHLILP